MKRRRPSTARRRGFSLIEALVVLAVAGAALMLIFSVGVRSTEIAFRLGRRALDLADRQVSTDALRGVVRGLVIPPTGSGARTGATDATGTPRRFGGPAVLATATPCAGSGPAAWVEVSLVGEADGDVITCRADDGPAVVLADLRPRRARFSYSEDGERWRDSWRATPRLMDRALAPREQGVYVRLATDDGRVEVIERATSGRPGPPPAAPRDASVRGPAL
ncbi:type II secretion system protein [Caulobacter sp. BK020]|uniref:prepilin-type N-terminal cleavage/methylation domain-containing protein n=1 Tax=Caulobacter sp. BK020 TaxID=2512117 RepID=UPI0010F395A1|nr:type II secretion system protein [Caulobacter sp. BK020]TCS10469.1 prepilin-type N-terminal cleavage/methylation domain-containing protein [Caulobacter sp. BK020]